MALKTLGAGCADRGNGNGTSQGPPAAGYDNTNIAVLVVYVSWSDLQPSDLGSFAASTAQALTGTGGSAWGGSTGKNLINFAGTYGAANSVYIVIRIAAGVYSPGWITTYSGLPAALQPNLPFSYTDPNTAQTGNCPAWWTQNFVAAYTNLLSLCAAQWDNPAGNGGNNAWLFSFSFGGTMTVFEECLLRGVNVTTDNPGTNQLGYVSCGYYLGGGSITTVGTDQWATDQCIQAHAAFTQTYCDMAFNPYQYLFCGPNVNNQVWTGPITAWRGTWGSGTTYHQGDGVDTVSGGNHVQYVCYKSGGAPAGTAVTNTTYWGKVTPLTSDSSGWDITVMGRMQSLLGNRALIGNKSFRQGYSFTSGTDPMSLLYQALASKGPGIFIQTAASAKVGNGSSSSPLTDIMDLMIAAGVNWCEEPNDYATQTGSTGANANGTYLPVGTTRTDAGCTTHNGTSTVQDTHILSTDIGSVVVGPGIPGQTTITSVSAGVSFGMSNNATAGATVSLKIVLGSVAVPISSGGDARHSAAWYTAMFQGSPVPPTGTINPQIVPVSICIIQTQAWPLVVVNPNPVNPPPPPPGIAGSQPFQLGPKLSEIFNPR